MKVILSKILKITAGGFHCWCDSNVGIIRKPNHAVPKFLWDTFLGQEPKESIVNKPMIPIMRTEKPEEEKLKWYQRLQNWIKGRIQKIIKSLKK